MRARDVGSVFPQLSVFAACREKREISDEPTGYAGQREILVTPLR
jgi:hypothetical protein